MTKVADGWNFDLWMNNNIRDNSVVSSYHDSLVLWYPCYPKILQLSQHDLKDTHRLLRKAVNTVWTRQLNKDQSCSVEVEKHDSND